MDSPLISVLYCRGLKRLHIRLFAALASTLLLTAPLRAAAVEAEVGEARGRSEFLRRLLRMHVGGSLSLNWRNVGPREPGYETQIQNEVYLADMYFGLDGPFVDGVPLQVEWHTPTGSDGRIQLNQANFKITRVDDWLFQFGKFLVPFGRYNELYRPDQYLTVTRPLLYASPDSLDLVVRPNSPRPPMSSGYTDIGARVTWYPPSIRPWVPEELTFFVVNGLGESSNRSRTFPDPENLGIPAPPTNGITIDFGHRNNNLADNNNNKAVGARAVFSVGDIPVAWPVPEGALDLKAVSVGFSGMGGMYDLEGRLPYAMYGVDLNFEYFGFSFSGEYMYSSNRFLAPVSTAAGTIMLPANQDGNNEIVQGFFLQAAFPLLKRPPWGERVHGILAFNQLYRRGPQLDFLLNFNDGRTTFPSLLAYNTNQPFITTRIDKYTAALNWALTQHFFLKFDYSYWVMRRASNLSSTSRGLVDIYQGALSMVVAF